MSKTSTTKRIGVKNLTTPTLNLKCADCVHFDIKAHSDIKKLCRDTGIKPYGRACDKMNPNTTRMSRSLGALEAVHDVLGGMSESEIRLFALAAIRAGDIAKNTKFRFGQKVFFNLSAPYTDFIDSYYSGVVVGFIPADQNSDKGYLHISGSLTDQAGTSIVMPIDSVLDEVKWNRHYLKLLNMNRFYTPDSKRLRVECGKEHSPDEDFIVPTLDMAASELESLSKQHAKGKGPRLNKAIDTFKSSSYNSEYDDLEEDEIEESENKTKQKGKRNRTDVVSFSHNQSGN